MNRGDLAALAESPLYWLGGYRRAYPGAFEALDATRASMNLPRWLFVGSGAAVQALTRSAAKQALRGPGGEELRQEIITTDLVDGALRDVSWADRQRILNDAQVVTTLAAWRMTKGVYAFDATLERELRRTPFTGRVPTSVLDDIPEWCVYVPLRDEGVRGAWFRLDFDESGLGRRLWVVLDGDGPQPIGVDLGGTLEEALTEWRRVLRDLAAADAAELGVNVIERRNQFEALLVLVPELVSLLLYLCSAEPEISGRGRPGNPRPVKTKHGPKLVAVQGVRSWDVGVVLGAALRAAQEREDETERDAGESGRSVRPHIRRAHWHTYLTGPRDGEQTPVLKWLHPTLVNAPDLDDMPVIVRPVR